MYLPLYPLHPSIIHPIPSTQPLPLPAPNPPFLKNHPPPHSKRLTLAPYSHPNIHRHKSLLQSIRRPALPNKTGTPDGLTIYPHPSTQLLRLIIDTINKPLHVTLCSPPGQGSQTSKFSSTKQGALESMTRGHRPNLAASNNTAWVPIRDGVLVTIASTVPGPVAGGRGRSMNPLLESRSYPLNARYKLRCTVCRSDVILTAWGKKEPLLYSCSLARL